MGIAMTCSALNFLIQLIHPHVIDTSLLYTKEFGQKYKLKVLAEAVLG